MAQPSYGAFTSPTDYNTQIADIQRRQKLAEALQAQGMQPSGGTEMVGGWAIPRSPMEGIGKMAQSLSGAYQQNQLKKEQEELNKKTQAEGEQWIREMPTAENQARKPWNVAGMDVATPQPTPEDLGQKRMEWAMRGAQMQNPLAQQLGGATITDEMKRARIQALVKQMTGGGQAGGVTPAGGGSGASGMMVPSALAAMLLDPDMKALAEAELKQRAPVNVRPGGTVYIPGSGPQFTAPNGASQINWQNGQPSMGTMPGALDAMGAQSQATAAGTQAGQAPYQMTTVNTEGAPTLMTNQQAIQAATGQPMPQPGMQPQPPNAVQPPVPGGYAGMRAQLAGLPVNPAGEPPMGASPQNLNAQGQPIQRVPGLRLQDQDAAARQREFGVKQGELDAMAPAARASVADATNNLQRMENAATEIMNAPNLGKITGLQGALPNMPGSGAADLDARLGALKSQVGFSVLQAMRDASKTGGALGAISDKENELLQRNLAALDKSQSPEAMKKSLQQLIDYAQGARERLARGYADQYERVVGNQGMKPTQQGAEPITRTQIIPPEGLAAQNDRRAPPQNLIRYDSNGDRIQ